MNNNIFFFFFLLALCSCKSAHTFENNKIPSISKINRVQLVREGIHRGDAVSIKMIVAEDLVNLLYSFKGNQKGYGAIFLKVQPEDEQQFNMGLVVHSYPRFEVGTKNLLISKGRAIDTVTKKRSYVVGVVLKRISEEKAMVIGEYFGGPTESVSFYYELEKKKGEWIITRRTVGSVA